MRTIIVCMAVLAGMVLTARIMELGKLRLLERHGVSATGQVLRAESEPRGLATIRVLIGEKAVDLNEPCVGFPCEVGSLVPVTILPGDVTVRVAGNLSQKLVTAELATFLFVPLFLVAGLTYSMWRANKGRVAARGGPRAGNLLPLVPILAAFGSVTSLALTVLNGSVPVRLQTLSALFLVTASVLYASELRGGASSSAGRRYAIFVLYGIGATLVVLDLTS